MGPANEWYVIGAIELLDCVLPEKVSGSSGTDEPALNFIGVWPHEVAHGSDVGDFLFSIQRPDIIQVLNIRWEPSMNT